jgi:hypothetical protein
MLKSRAARRREAKRKTKVAQEQTATRHAAKRKTKVRADYSLEVGVAHEVLDPDQLDGALVEQRPSATPASWGWCLQIKEQERLMKRMRAP